MNLLTPTCVAASDILSCVSWKNTKAFKTIAEKETQLKHYKRMGASAEVLQLVELESKPFGSVAEKMMCEIFGLGPRTSTQNDATLGDAKIEIKCARYWAGKEFSRWRAVHSGWFQVPLLYAWHDVSASGSMGADAAAGELGGVA